MNAAQQRVLVRALFTLVALCAVAMLAGYADKQSEVVVQAGLLGFVAYAIARFLRMSAVGKSE